jgi:cytochrome c-type biogenesis protein CcmF
MQVTEGGIQPLLTPVGTEFFAVLGRMDAATRAVDLKLMFQKPLYPLEVFYKPMTSLVWVGTGILTIGGLMSAFARRRRHSKAPAPLSPVEV